MPGVPARGLSARAAPLWSAGIVRDDPAVSAAVVRAGRGRIGGDEPLGSVEAFSGQFAIPSQKAGRRRGPRRGAADGGATGRSGAGGML